MTLNAKIKNDVKQEEQAAQDCRCTKGLGWSLMIIDQLGEPRHESIESLKGRSPNAKVTPHRTAPVPHEEESLKLNGKEEVRMAWT